MSATDADRKKAAEVRRRMSLAGAYADRVLAESFAEIRAAEREAAWRDGWESAKAFLLAPVVFRSDEDAAAAPSPATTTSEGN